jgi:hypothetical protein
VLGVVCFCIRAGHPGLSLTAIADVQSCSGAPIGVRRKMAGCGRTVFRMAAGCWALGAGRWAPLPLPGHPVLMQISQCGPARLLQAVALPVAGAGWGCGVCGSRARAGARPRYLRLLAAASACRTPGSLRRTPNSHRASLFFRFFSFSCTWQRTPRTPTSPFTNNKHANAQLATSCRSLALSPLRPAAAAAPTPRPPSHYPRFPLLAYSLWL